MHEILTLQLMCPVQAYNLIQPKELAPLQDLITQMLNT